MWSEGLPTSTATQRILFWQRNTMQMMYEVIYKALEEAGLENTYEPQEYLNFFCLSNREAKDLEGSSDAGNSTATNTPQEDCFYDLPQYRVSNFCATFTEDKRRNYEVYSLYIRRYIL